MMKLIIITYYNAFTAADTSRNADTSTAAGFDNT